MLKNHPTTEQEEGVVSTTRHCAPPPQRPSRWAGVTLSASVFLAQFAGFCLLAFHRLIDSDEGFYLYISKLVATKGTVPYKDVFYQQMPLLPYIYGLWMRVFGFNWEAGRSLSAFFAALVGTLVFWQIRRASRHTLLALVCTSLYAFNISDLLFFLTAKTYVLSSALLLGSLLAGAGSQGRRGGWLGGICGLLLALSIETRLFFAAVIPVFVIWFWARQDSGVRRRPFWFFLAGFSIGMIPSMIFVGASYRQFIYDNVLYHSMRDPAGLVGDFRQKMAVMRKLLFGAVGLHPTQFLALLLGLPLALIFWKKLGATAKLAAAVSIVLGLASFLPTPTFGQYFCVLVPFLILCVAGAFESAAEALSGFVSYRMLTAGFAVFACVYSAVAIPRINSFFLREDGVPGIDPATQAVDWKLSTIKEIAGVIESNTDKDSPVVTSWPGYLLSIDRQAYPKMENQISVDTAWKISPEEADEFKMLREDDLLEAIADARVKVVVAGNCSHGRRSLYREAVRKNNYRLVASIGKSEIYAR